MAELVLGIVDIPYENEGLKYSKPNKKGRSKSRVVQPTTTVQVAKRLEEKYHVYQIFYDQNQDDILKAVIHSCEGALEDLYANGTIHDPFIEAGKEIELGFRQWLQQGEIEELGIPGIPTKAANERRSSRFAASVGPSQRPSFIDTSNYELSFRSWIEG